MTKNNNENDEQPIKVDEYELNSKYTVIVKQ